MILKGLLSRLKSQEALSVRYYAEGKLASKSFADMGRDVHHVVRHLAQHGVGPGVRVGIMANNSYEWLVYDLALVELEAIEVPLPVDVFGSTPPDELSERYGLQLMLVDGERRHLCRSWIVDMPLQALPPFELKTLASPPPEESDLFTLVFSSGTSGRTKCLKISKLGTEALIMSFGRDFRFRASDLILAFLPLSSFQQRWMLYTAIHYGFNLGLTVPARLFHALRDMRPTVLGAAPLLYETIESRYYALPPGKKRLVNWARAILAVLPQPLRLPAARLLLKPFHDALGGNIHLAIAGAAPIRRSTLDFFQSIGLTLYSAYGLTEAGFLSWNVPGAVKLGSVGKEVYPGAIRLAEDGEIVFHHPHLLSYGYFGLDPEEERKTFPGPAQIATGDIGRFDSDGYLHIIGRKKDIIVTQGGYKLQPEDLERTLEKNQSIARAVVMGGGDLACIVALISTREEPRDAVKAAIEAEVQALNRTLPPPSRIGKVVFTGQQFTLESGLLNRNLKIDRVRVLDMFRGELVGAANGN